MSNEPLKRVFQVMVRLDRETYDELVEAARKRDRKVGELARTLLEESLGIGTPKTQDDQVAALWEKVRELERRLEAQDKLDEVIARLSALERRK